MKLWSTRSTTCSMIGPSSRSSVTIVRRRADQLDAARMRLVIRLGALEARQERMMDVDRAAGEPLAQLIREDLHVAREHHQLGPGSRR